MTRPVAALTSELLVRKGMARPLGLQPTEQTPNDVVLAVRPALSLVDPPSKPTPNSYRPLYPPIRTRRTMARLSRTWSALAARWGLPTILFVIGIAVIAIVAATGPSAPPPLADIGAPAIRPLGPTPVSWVDNGLMASPALAGR